ncbi:DEAD/DEAH box helicase [Chryseobacterium vrystaatense]|uniref:ATP-dependent helicase Lhr and Lhr-like helicase n=1 Tax=Chryseobacterium vrystaatense TaxID=307480 RepID=A0A1M5EDJ1_9FLAO|nr:DEAD/DEAH box helicase [Chryseobacterium vrystaatense]KFF25806.1 DEAD/DEAH box helicase [Chryseobacterium vrystaatense]SHF77266.1 ATP-dependent helicase Lhr and Lhr-like helicase [Chryseobacterium vrystaatense]
MTAFNLLSEPIRKYIRDQKWESLRPIQEAAIQRIIATDNNYVLISRTASGKTEAAFLPILSKVNFKEQGVKVLYISPLIALINDQFTRVEKLCAYLDVPVTKWHGEASKGAKDRLIKAPEGIVLITPESLEAMFVNKPYNIHHLFSTLDYVVIDEIHSFLGSDRGIHLQSLLQRLQKVNKNTFSTVALSATVSDEHKYAELKDFLGDPAKTKVIRDIDPKPITAVFKYFEGSVEELPLDLLKDLYIRTRDRKILVFPNARGRVEEVAVKLKKLSEKVGGHTNYFSHHSSVDKEVREYVEFFAKKSTHENFCISCTSTLELGIDIGNVDEVAQIDATHSIASLIQRVGRSGRREGKSSSLFLYATNQWSLLQSAACWLLFKEHYIEPVSINSKPYDVLVHQLLSIVKGSSGITLSKLSEEISGNAAFKNITVEETIEIIAHLTAIDFLEKLGQEYIIGIEGEKVVNTKDFYTLFHTPVFFRVSSQGVKIGELPLSPQIRTDENIYLSARIWKITDIDYESKKIEVMAAKDGNKPRFFGDAADIAPKIRETMLEILMSVEQYDFLDEAGQEAVRQMRKKFSVYDLKSHQTDRPLFSGNDKLTFYSFTGSRVNRTLSFILKRMGIKNELFENESEFELEFSQKSDFMSVFKDVNLNNVNFDHALAELIETSPEVLSFSKWGIYLPVSFQAQLLRHRYFDFEGCNVFLQNLNFVENQ